jgi:hypothetical protein
MSGMMLSALIGLAALILGLVIIPVLLVLPGGAMRRRAHHSPRCAAACTWRRQESTE